jgi:hypothetical protein
MSPTSSAPISRRAFAGGLAAFSGATLAMGVLAPSARATIPVTPAPMAPNLQTLGWWMRRTSGKTMAEVRPYYEQVIGLPLVRPWENDLVLLWAGEDHIFEVKTDDNPPRADPDPLTATCVPVFRAHDLAEVEARMARFGHKPVSERRARWGRSPTAVRTISRSASSSAQRTRPCPPTERRAKSGAPARRACQVFRRCRKGCTG